MIIPNQVEPYPGLNPFEEKDAFFFFGRDESCEEIIDGLTVHSPIVLYGESGVGKSSLLQAGVVSRLRTLTNSNPKFAIAVFKDWSDSAREELLPNIVKAVKNSVANAIKKQPDEPEFKDKIKSIKNAIQEEAKKYQYPEPSEFFQDLWAWVNILREKDKDWKLLIILDQFEGYFQSKESSTKEDKVLIDLAEAVNARDLLVNFVFAIQSDEFFRLEQQVKKYIPTIDKNCIVLKHLDTNSAKEAIKRPIERYNLLESLKNYSMTVLSGSKKVGKSSMLQMGLIPCWSNDGRIDEKSKISSFPHVLIHDWNNNSFSNLVKEIKNECNKSLRSEKAKTKLFKSETLKDVLQNWENFTKEDSLDGKLRKRNLLVIFDQFENYLEAYPTTVFSKDIKPLLSCQSVSLLISINDKDKVNFFSRLQSFLDSNEDLKKAWSDEYFILGENNSLVIQSKIKPPELEKFAIEDEDTFVGEITNALDEIDGEQQHKIIAPYLQLVMTNLCNKAINKAKEENSVSKLSLKTVEALGIDRIKREIKEGKRLKLQVSNLCEFVVSNKLTKEQRKALIYAIKKIFKKNIKLTFTSKNIGTDKHSLVDAITSQYSNVSDRMGKFLDGVEVMMGNDNPLKTYKSLEDQVSSRTKPNEVIKDGVKEIIDDHVKDAVRELEDKLIEDKRNNPKWNEEEIKKTNGIKTVLRILSHLSTPSGSKSTVSVDDIVNYLQEDNSILDLELPVVERQDIENVTKRLRAKRILRSISTSTKNGEDHEERYEIYFNGLSEAFQARRLEYISQIVNIQKNEYLPTRALSELIHGDIELAAVYANSAYDNHCNTGFPGKLDLVNEAFREVLKKDFNCCLVNPRKTEKDFWQVALHPNKSMMAAGNHDGTVWLWNDIKSKSKPKTFDAHKADVRRKGEPPDIALAFNAAGTILASSSRGKLIKLWDVDELTSWDGNPPEPKPIVKFPSEQLLEQQSTQYEFTSVAFGSPDGDILAAGDWAGNIWLWDVSKPTNPHQINNKPLKINGDNNWLWSVTFSPDGKTLAAGASDGWVYLWYSNDFKELKEPVTLKPSEKMPEQSKSNNKEIFSVAFSPDGNWLASGHADHSISLWKLSKGNGISLWKLSKEFQEFQENYKHQESVRAVTFNPKEKDSDTTKYLFSASEDRTIKIWDLNFNETANKDKTIKIWDPYLNEKPKILDAYPSTVCSVVCLSKDSLQLISCGWDRTIRYWIETEAEQKIIEEPNKEEPNKDVIAVAFNELTPVSAFSDGTVNGLGKLPQLEKDDGNIVAVTFFSPNGKIQKMARGSNQGIIRIFDFQNPEKFTPIEAHQKISSLAFSPDWKILVSVSPAICGRCQVKFWDVGQTVQKSKDLKYNIEREITSVAFHPKSSPSKGYILAVASNDGKIELWNLLENDKPLFTELYHHTGILGSGLPFIVLFSPDGKWLASAGDNSYIQIWKVSDSNQLNKNKGYTLPVSVYGVTALAFSEDGKWLASGFYNGRIELWDLKNFDPSQKNRKPVSFLLKEHDKQVNTLCFSFGSKNKTLLSGSADGKVCQWTIDIDDLVNRIKSKLRYSYTENEPNDNV